MVRVTLKQGPTRPHKHKDPTKRMVSVSPLYRDLEPECEVIMFIWSFRPLAWGVWEGVVSVGRPRDAQRKSPCNNSAAYMKTMGMKGLFQIRAHDSL